MFSNPLNGLEKSHWAGVNRVPFFLDLRGPRVDGPFDLRLKVHTPSYPLASVVSNPLYKGYMPLLRRGV